MTTPTPVRTLTVEEFARTTDPDGMCSELLFGEVVHLPPADTEHSYVSGNVYFALKLFTRMHPELGIATTEGGFIVTRDPDTVRAPDAAWISAQRAPGGRLRGYVNGAPNLAVEVVSAGDRDQDVASKIRLWLDAGAERVWEIRPRADTVTVHTRDGTPLTLGIGDELRSEHAAFPIDGFSLSIALVFE